ELGTGAPGHLPKMAKAVQPDVAIVTLVALEHFSAFRTREAVAVEKGALVEAVRPGGFAVLNKDDPRVLAMVQRTKARIVTFGNAPSDYAQEHVSIDELGRVSLTLCYRGKDVRLRSQLLGAHSALAVTAASACALELGVPAEVVAERVSTFEAMFGR